MSSDEEQTSTRLTSVIDDLIREENSENSRFTNKKERYRPRIRGRGRARRPYSRALPRYPPRRSYRGSSRRRGDYDRFISIANDNVVIRKGLNPRSRSSRYERPSTRKKLVIKSFGRGKRRVDEERTSIRGQRTSTRGQRRGNEERYSSKRSSSHLFRKHDEKKNLIQMAVDLFYLKESHMEEKKVVEEGVEDL
eukprot:Anaeramoba_flamelloidesc42260_g1_i2.p1 GENE.c42260_g1_i2~~c42260_g1_i2.p1  ORF type:complete len:194 (-),score=30.95 c42260_g1_i2:41-622(-)